MAVKFEGSEVPNPTIQRDRFGGYMLSDVRIMWKNFGGKKTQFNAAGDRNFHVVLTPEIADELAAAGMNVKQREPRDPEDPPLLHLKVSVKDASPFLQIYYITDRGRTQLDPDTFDLVDSADIERVDLVLGRAKEPYNVGGHTGYAVYLNRAYITVREDEFERRYSQVPEGASGAAYNDNFEALQGFDD